MKQQKPPAAKPTSNAQGFPTAFELAQLAGLLSGKSSPQDASKLAREAFQLWEACAQELTGARILDALRNGDVEVRALGIVGVPGEVPKSWPCSFDEALRRVMPKKRTRADRHGLFRLFLRELIQTSTSVKRYSKKGRNSQPQAPSEKTTLDQIEAGFKALKQQGFKNCEEYGNSLQPFSRWLSMHEYRTMSEQRQKAARARWEKKP